MRKIGKFYFLVLIVIFLFLFLNISCVTTSNSNTNKNEKENNKQTETKQAIPEWLNKYTPEDDKFYYFVGSSSEQDTENEADEQAFNDVYRKIFALIGITVSSSMEKSDVYKTSENKEEFKSVLKSLLKTSSEGKIKNIKVIDRYVKKLDNGKIIVYIYISVPKEVIKKEQERLEKLYKEKINSFVLPEQKANIALKNGDIYESIYNTIVSIKNVSSTDYENKEIVIKKGLDRLYFLSSNIKTDLIIPEEKLIRGEKQNTPFVYKVYFEYNNEKIPVKNIPVKFFYKNLNSKNEIQSYEYETSTDINGLSYFKYDKIPFSGKTFLIAFININELINDLQDTLENNVSNSIYINKVKSIKSNFNDLKIRKDIEFISNTINFKTEIFYSFLDNNNTPINGIITSEFEDYLSEIGVPFNIQNGSTKIYENIDNYISKNKDKILKNGFKRVMVIQGVITTFKEYSGKIVAASNITIKIYYLNNDTVKTLSIKSSGNGNNKINAFKDAIIKGLKKAETKLLLYL